MTSGGFLAPTFRAKDHCERHNGQVGEVLAQVLAAALQAVAAAWRGAAHSLQRPVRRRDWLTVTLACLTASLFVPMTVGAAFLFRGVLRVLDDDLFWFFGIIIGLPLGLMALTVALLGVAAGVTVGAWLLADRPLSRAAAAALAVVALLVGWTLLETQDPLTGFIGQATIVLAGPLLVLVAAALFSANRSVNVHPSDAALPSARSVTRNRFTL